MASHPVGRLRLAWTSALFVSFVGLLLCLSVSPALAATAEDPPTPNPAPNETVTPSELPLSPVPAPAPPDFVAVVAPGNFDQPIGQLREAMHNRATTHTVPQAYPRAHAERIGSAPSPWFAQSLLLCGGGALAIATFGLVRIGVRRRLW